VDPDLIFNTVLKCYPEKSKLGAGMKFNIDEYDPEGWLEATKHYIGVIGKMPFYSTTEQSRELNGSINVVSPQLPQ
jgi:hypothetical protein